VILILGNLTPESLALVIEELFEASPKWYDTGLMLGLSYSILDNIKHQNEERDCFREMLKAWFKHAQDCSWKALVGALNTSLVGEQGLGGRLEKKYISTGKSIFPHTLFLIPQPFSY